MEKEEASINTLAFDKNTIKLDSEECQDRIVKLDKRAYVDSDIIASAAIELFKARKAALTAEYLVVKGICKDKDHASRTLRHNAVKGILIKPTSERPPRYYPKALEFEVNEHLAPKNVNLNPTGIHPYLTRQSSIVTSRIPATLEDLNNHKADDLHDAITMLDFLPHYIHNLKLSVKLHPDVYDSLKMAVSNETNKTKHLEARLGRRFLYFDVNKEKAVITIVSSQYPIPIQTDADIDDFYILLGMVRERVIQMLHEPDELLQPTSEWILTQCDVNQDIPITAKAQLTLCKAMQVSVAGHTFRRYVKNQQGKPVYRIEESIAPAKPVIEAVKAIKASNERMVIAQ